MNIYIIVSLMAFVVCLSLGSFVYIKGKEKPANRSFAVVTVLIGIWSLFPFLTNIAPNELKALFWTRLVYITALFTPPTFLHFMFTVMEIERNKRERVILIISYIIFALFLTVLFNPGFIQGVTYFAPFRAVIPGPLYLVFITFFGLAYIYPTWKLLNLFCNSRGYKRNQLKYVLLAFFAATIGGIMHFLAAYTGKEPFPHDFLIIGYASIMTYAIVAHRLMDINVVITRGFAYGSLTAIIAGVYVGLMAGVDRIFAGVAGYNPTLVHALLFIVVFFALIYVLPQMKIRAIELTRRTLFRGKYDYQEELSEATKVIPTMLNLERLGRYILTKIRDTMMVDKLCLFVYDETDHIYRFLASSGLDKDAASKIKIGENSALAGLLRDAGKPLIKEELERTSAVPGEAMGLAIEQLSSLGAELCIPLMLKDDLAGIVTLSNKKSGEMFTDEDLELLATLANQVALTIEYIKAIDKISSEKRYVGLGKAAMRMAHDIKNPLVPLKTFLQILPDKYPHEFAEMSKIDKEFTGRFYESALEGVDRINNLIERALHYARHPEPVFSKVELDNLLDDVLTQEEVDIKKGKVQLQKQYSPSGNSLEVDEEQLIELFSNLIANSIDAMEEAGTRKLTVKTQGINGQVTVEIIDTGCGIPEDRIDTIFDPFITYKHQGSGLGLAIAKKIVDDHKGTIEVNSEPGKGTNFKVTLPRKQ